MLSLSLLCALTAMTLSVVADRGNASPESTLPQPARLLAIVTAATKQLIFAVDGNGDAGRKPEPAFLMVRPEPLLFHHGDAIRDLENKVWTREAYGFSQVFDYTVLDQKRKPLRRRDMVVREKIVFVGGNVDVGMKPNEVSSSSIGIDSEGRFADLHALFTETKPALPPGSFVKFKQILSVFYEGREYTLGSVCIDKYVDRVELRLYSSADADCS